MLSSRILFNTYIAGGIVSLGFYQTIAYLVGGHAFPSIIYHLRCMPLCLWLSIFWPITLPSCILLSTARFNQGTA